MSELQPSDAPSLLSLPPQLHASFAHLVQRLQAIACPLAPQLAGGAGGGAIDVFVAGEESAYALVQNDDATLHGGPHAAPLVLRLALFQWLLSRYDADLPRAFLDLPAEYADQRAMQAMLGHFKRVLRICNFLGVIPASASPQQGLALLSGGAPAALQLRLLHTLVDLIAAVPGEGFFASSRQFSAAPSYAPHVDVEFHKHVRLLHCVSQIGTATAHTSLEHGGMALTQSANEHLLSEHIELFPPTILMTANALRQVKDKQQVNKRGSLVQPDPQQLTAQIERLQREMEDKQLVLAKLQETIPLTAHEDYQPSLTQLENRLQTLVQLLLQFTSEYESKFQPLAEAVLTHPLQLSSLGPALSRVAQERQDVSRLLSACSATHRNFSSLLRQQSLSMLPLRCWSHPRQERIQSCPSRLRPRNRSRAHQTTKLLPQRLLSSHLLTTPH